MAQVTEAQLFEMMGRLFAELRAINTENEQLHALVAQLEGQHLEAEADEVPKEPEVAEED